MNDYLNALNETFSQEGALTPEKLMAFSNATLKFFQEVQTKLASEDPEVKEAALKEAASMKIALEEKLKGLCDRWGIDPAQLNGLMPDPSLFTSKDPSQMTQNPRMNTEDSLPPFKIKA